MYLKTFGFSKQSQSKMYIITWKSKITGATGQGTRKVELKTAEEWVKYMNEKHPDIEHNFKMV